MLEMDVASEVKFSFLSHGCCVDGYPGCKSVANRKDAEVITFVMALWRTGSMSNQRCKLVTENKQSTIDTPTGCVVKIQANGIKAGRHRLKMVAHNGRENVRTC
jgi:hypothetical protein